MELPSFQVGSFKPNFNRKITGEEEGTEKFDTVKRLSQETSVYVTGVVKRKTNVSKFGYELDVTAVESSVNHMIIQSHQKNTELTS